MKQKLNLMVELIFKLEKKKGLVLFEVKAKRYILL